MAQRAIPEFHAKKLLAEAWEEYFPADLNYSFHSLLFNPNTDTLDSSLKSIEWDTNQFQNLMKNQALVSNSPY